MTIQTCLLLATAVAALVLSSAPSGAPPTRWARFSSPFQRMVAEAAPMRARRSNKEDEGFAGGRRRRRRRTASADGSSHRGNSFGDDFGDDGTASLDLSVLYRTSRPRDVLDGFVSGIGNVVRGCLAGFASAVALPLAGAWRGGVLGFVVGGITGSISGVILAAMGGLTAAQQALWGIAGTVEAVRQSQRGRVWNDERGKWADYNLDAEAVEVRRSLSRGNGGSAGGRSFTVKDTTYYDLLGISPDALDGQIKRSYYKAAKILHPDKNPDKDAAERFRDLSVAYQVLSDRSRRAKYDQGGISLSDGDDLGSNLDPLVFVSLLFGSDLVESYVGELSIASFFDGVMQLSRTGQQIDLWDWTLVSDLSQRRRAVDIAIKLRDRVGPYVSGEIPVTEFIDGCRAEARRIATGTFGPTFLVAIGDALVRGAEAYIGYHTTFWGLGGYYAWVSQKADGTIKGFRTASSFLSLMREGRRAYFEVKEEDPEYLSEINREHSIRQMSEKSLPSLLKFAWSINLGDISKTLRSAVFKLLSDSGASSMDERLRRAEGMKVLGGEFLTIGRSNVSDQDLQLALEDIVARVEDAMQATMMKAHGMPKDMKSETKRKMKRAA